MSTTQESVQNRMNQDRLSIAAAARGMGVSSATLSLWLRDTYPGDNAMVERHAQRWLTTQADRQTLEFRLDVHVELAVTMELMTDLATIKANNDCVLIYGPAGTGKTHALRHFAESRSHVCVTTMSPAVTTPAGVLTRIAQALDTGANIHRATRLEDLLAERLKGRGALLCIDEAHHLRPALLDQIRVLYDRAGCSLALVGNEPLWSKLSESDRAAQIVSRVGIQRHLGAPAATDLHTLASALLDRPLNPREQGRITQLGKRAGGLRAVHKTIRDAYAFARASNRRQPDHDDVLDAIALREV